jgi:hypothetical protein
MTLQTLADMRELVERHLRPNAGSATPGAASLNASMTVPAAATLPAP